MARVIKEIVIDNIFGGFSALTYFSKPGEYVDANNIDPGIDGFLRPTLVSNITSTLAGTPFWMISNPKDSNVYVYDSAGSVYSISSSAVLSDLGDLTDGGSASANGSWYLDNYIYFVRDTTVARYGPLNGTPAFTDDYWVGTLGKTALVDTSSMYPYALSVEVMPSHVGVRHSDGAAYFTDIVGNQGTIHKIKTSKTTVEGDTDNGSEYDSLDLGYGYYPTAIESFGEYVVIGIYEGNSTQDSSQRAKLAFWDTSSLSPNKLVFEDFPNKLITAIKNDNGRLYIYSSSTQGDRHTFIHEYLGGSVFKQVSFLHYTPPVQGGVLAKDSRIYHGGDTNVFAKGNFANSFDSIHAIASSSTTTGNRDIVSIASFGDNPINTNLFIGAGTSIDSLNASYLSSAYSTYFQSQYFKIGKPFKIKRIRFNTLSTIPDNLSLDVSFSIDGNTCSLSGITNQTHPTKHISKLVPGQGTNGGSSNGNNHFNLEIYWTTSSSEIVTNCVIALPIIIDVEIEDDNV